MSASVAAAPPPLAAAPEVQDALQDGPRRPPAPASAAQQAPSAELLAGLQQLAAQLKGSLTLHQGAATHQADGEATVWNELLKADTPAFTAARPLAWVRCADARDAGLAVAFAARHKVKLSGRGAGHHYGGACMSPGGLVLDLSPLKGVSVDAEGRTARVEAGLTTQELREATIAHGLHFPGGHISGVGCAGFILGGGNGWGATQWGAACDNVFAYDVILPRPPAPVQEGGAEGAALDGDAAELGPAPVTRVTVESDPELFAALRGAGMFVAVVVAFHVRLHPVPSTIPTITAVLPLSSAPKALELLQDLLQRGPACVEPSVALVRGPAPDHEPIAVFGATAFAPLDDPRVHEAYAKVRALEPEARHSLQEEQLPYLRALAILDGAYVGPRLCMYAHGMFVEHAAVTPALTQAWVEAAERMTSPRSLLLIVPSCASVPQAAPSSLDFRDMLFVCAYSMWQRTDGGPQADGDEAHAQWVRRVRAGVGPAAVGSYVNEVMLEPGQLAHCYRPETLSRVAAVKRRTDPLGLLRALELDPQP